MVYKVIIIAIIATIIEAGEIVHPSASAVGAPAVSYSSVGGGITHGHAVGPVPHAVAPAAPYTAGYPVPYIARSPVPYAVRGLVPYAPVQYAAAPAFARFAAPLQYPTPSRIAGPHIHQNIPVSRAQIAEPYDVPQYDFGYSISDAITGDVKEQQESRLGDQVRGRYSFIEADGTRRIVEYTADDVHGFNAVVRREPAGVAPAVGRAQPVPGYAAAPIARLAPVPHLQGVPAPAIGYSSYH